MDINVDRSFRRYPRHIKEVETISTDTRTKKKPVKKLKFTDDPDEGFPVYGKILIVLLVVAVGVAIASVSCLLLGRGLLCMKSGNTWSDWSKCSSLCGPGNQTRSRSSSGKSHTETETRECFEKSGCNNTNPEEGAAQAWSKWSDWSSCSQTCGKGSETRQRHCRSTTSGHTLPSSMCQSGTDFEKKTCTSKKLCVSFAWTSWSEWTSCHKQCIQQNSTRTRQCNDGKSWKPVDSKKCPGGNDKETVACVCNDFLNLKNYHKINGSDCIDSKYSLKLKYPKTAEVCSKKCDEKANCQAFTMSRGFCELFIFNKCSKGVSNCQCNRKSSIYVKIQTGLDPGSLCPSDFGHSNCGIKYKLFYPLVFTFDFIKNTCDKKKD
ncbi:hypothetical protein BOX15_Mlig008364g1 [Macrostomum lignano]|uniref:Apple domain-containing protein n=2 Tax=Macrostomum lignano TaxID=282301 RepID=A0A267FKI1_9PLAT|nr:hypothetical protein BOX15_Mlig008364g6 [Macrostomum lignano]PAA50464.1 hypothetical protein BOX15_Mlig008364g5 [Macrostomum lignano]PAA64167.1 hypothetical protein BOX15_Mlig008364g4 [Macrostomum lignano]PAA73647.1 hypothetical protein BOX15_Mlig008364g1 [Macrostomum lignano]